MGYFALVVCLRENSSIKSSENFCKALVNRIKLLFKKYKKTKVENWFEWINVSDEYGFYLIKLPYEIHKLKELNKNKIKSLSRKISGNCIEKGIDFCILPEILQNIFECSNLFKKSLSGHFLYKSILVNIIKEVYFLKQTFIGDLDVAIIYGKDKEEPVRVLNLLSGLVKYITVVTEHKDSIENEINRILEDTGLAVGITSNCKSAFKNAQLVINFDKLKSGITSSSKGKVIVNYGEIYAEENTEGNTLINGVIIKLPQPLKQELTKTVLDFFSETEIAEILISYITGCTDIMYENKFVDADLYERISYEFENGGYKINGFI